LLLLKRPAQKTLIIIRRTKCTSNFALLKILTTIFFALFITQSFAQVDEDLQRMIDSAKNQQQINKPLPIVKDTQKPVVKNLPVNIVKKDSNVKRPVIDTSSITADPFAAIDTTAVLIFQDSLQRDSAIAVIPAATGKTVSWKQDTAFMRLLAFIPLKIKMPVLFRDGNLRQPPAKDNLFYLLTCVVLLLAIIRQLFPRYFLQLYRIMFQASFRQKQTREQLMQETMPSLLMNILFIIVGGLFIALIADIYKLQNTSFWWLTLYSITVLALVYMSKFLVIQFMGWAFQVKEPATTYGFIVFLINKIIGLALLPLLLVLAFSTGYTQQITITIAACVVGLLLALRYILSLTIIRGTLSVHPIHFFIYLCAVELMPMLVIYKVLINYTGKTN